MVVEIEEMETSEEPLQDSRGLKHVTSCLGLISHQESQLIELAFLYSMVGESNDSTVATLCGVFSSKQ